MSSHRLLEMFADLGFFELDPHGKVRDWSEAASRLLGIGPEEIIGRSAEELHTQAPTVNDLSDSLNVAKTEGRSESFGWIKRSDGTRFWANQVTIPLRTASGEIDGYARVIRDVTTWKAAEDERDRLFMLSPDMICIAGFDGFFKRVNPSFSRVLGYPESEFLSRPFSEFLHPEDVAPTSATMAAFADLSHNALKPLVNRYRCADGSYRWLEWISEADFSEKRIYAVARDVTLDKEREQKLSEYAAELERSNRELLRFAYIASHDLQEPLRAVAGCVDMLAERNKGQLDERSLELMGHAVDGAKRMQELINDLLAYSRIGSKGINREWIESRLTAELALKHLGVAIAESKAIITIGAMPRAWVDRVQFVQLFQNLIGNAIKFRKSEPPQIDVQAQTGNGETIFSVRDNGIGIAPEYQSRLFQVFQRLNRRSEYAGTGIGLAICKKIVERHGGRIWIESQANQGTTFLFSIPDGANS